MATLRPARSLVRQIDGQNRTFLVYGDNKGPLFQRDMSHPLKVHPDGLEFGYVVHGKVTDDSFGTKDFRKQFDDLSDRPIIVDNNGVPAIWLDFRISDLAGNRTNVRVKLVLDESAPVIPGTTQQELPARELPDTLNELIEYYLSTGQGEKLEDVGGGS